MGYGIESEEKLPKKNSSSGASFIRELFLGDRGVAHMRFVSDTQGIYVDMVHTVQTIKNGNTFFGKELCTMETDGKCVNCDQGLYASPAFWAWVYVTTIEHATPPKNIETEERIINKSRVYVKNVNDFRVWTRGFGKDQVLWNQIRSYQAAYGGTLCDRLFDVRRTGTGKNTTYQLIGLIPLDVDSDIDARVASLPALHEYAAGKINTMEGTLFESNANQVQKVDNVVPEGSDELVSLSVEEAVDVDNELEGWI